MIGLWKARWIIVLLIIIVVSVVAPVVQAQRDLVVMVLDPNFHPFVSVTGNGQAVGFSFDVTKAVVRQARLRVRYERAQFGYIVPGVSTHLYDAAATCVFATDERRQWVDFSEPYLTTGVMLVVHEDNNTIQSAADLVPGIVVSARQGTATEAYARSRTTAEVRPVLSVPETLEQVASGNADAALIIETELRPFLHTHPNTRLKAVGGLLTTGHCAIAVNKDETELLIRLNTGLTRLRNSGKLDEIRLRWFGNYLLAYQTPEPATIPPTPTVSP
jgi:ABC-type amino acid transport substrate-binding protein